MARELPFVDLARRFFACEEVAAFQTGPSNDRRELFYRVWTRKEAYVKARGVGLRLSLRSFAVSTGEEPGLTRVDDGKDWMMADLDVGKEHYAAVVAPIGAKIDSRTYKWPNDY